MHKTLASLAIAMTATAVGLHLMDPSASAGRGPLTVQEVQSLTRDLVGGSVQIKPGQWRDVEITTDDQVVSTGLTLAASRDHRDCHFFVDAAGRPSRESQWANQLQTPGNPHTIRIHLELGNPDGPSPAQWFTARSIILALDSALSAKGALPVLSKSFDFNTVLYSSNL